MFDTIKSPLIMGILNTTPDSFSDGGQYTQVTDAIQQVRVMLQQGADIIDVGGESTRPGSQRVSVEEQINRVVPVINSIRKHFPEDVLISIDTTRRAVAQAALQAGANIINDISAATEDDEMLNIAVEHDAPIILMHKLGTPENMQDNPEYEDVVGEILMYLLQRAETALQAGVKRQNIAIDPGIGFGKRKQDNLDLIAHLQRFVSSGYPVLLGASRKRFMGAVCQIEHPRELVTATAVTTALGVMAGVKMFRVHDVKENKQAADVAWAVYNRKKLTINDAECGVVHNKRLAVGRTRNK